MKYQIFTFFCFLTQISAVFGRTEINEVVYTTSDGYSIPIKIYLPDNVNSLSPVQFYVHGGGWNGGNIDGVPPATIASDGLLLCDPLGVVYVGLAYRCKGNNGTFQKAIEDLEASVSWFLDRAVEYNADISRIGFSGSSAGSTLASVMAQKYDACKLFIGNEGMYNIVDLDNELSGFPDAPSREDYGLVTPEEKLNASAFYNLRFPIPPASLLLQGKDDWLCHYSQTEEFSAKIIASGGECKTVFYESINHTSLSIDYPGVLKNSILEIGEHLIEEFQILGRDLVGVESQLDTWLSDEYPYEVFPENLLYEGSWQDKRGSYYFNENGTCYHRTDSDIDNYTYTVDNAKLILSNDLETKVFYMRKNDRTLYELILQEGRYKSRVYNYSLIPHPKEIYVKEEANGDGSSLDNALGSLQDAYAMASSNIGDDIIVVSGEIIVTTPVSLTDAFDKVQIISANVGYGGMQGIITNTASANQVFRTTTDAANTEIIGIYFQNITGSGAGGFIGGISTSHMVFDNCQFTNLVTLSGNGNININNTSFTFNLCKFYGNTTLNGSGGVFFVTGNGQLTIDKCLFENNSSKLINTTQQASGGAILVSSNGNLAVVNSTFYKNTTEYQGGAVAISGNASADFSNVTMFENNCVNTDSKTTFGGGLSVGGAGGTLSLNNSLLYNNISDSSRDMRLTGTKQKYIYNTLCSDFNAGGAIPIIISSNLNADLASSNLYFDDLVGVVKYGSSNLDSPIDFGDASLLPSLVDQLGNDRISILNKIDAGAWDSEKVLATQRFENYTEIKEEAIIFSDRIQFKNVMSNSLYQIYSFPGELQKKGTINKDDIINIDFLKDGAYFIRLESGYAIKFIKI